MGGKRMALFLAGGTIGATLALFLLLVDKGSRDAHFWLSLGSFLFLEALFWSYIVAASGERRRERAGLALQFGAGAALLLYCAAALTVTIACGMLLRIDYELLLRIHLSLLLLFVLTVGVLGLMGASFRAQPSRQRVVSCLYELHRQAQELVSLATERAGEGAASLIDELRLLVTETELSDHTVDPLLADTEADIASEVAALKETLASEGREARDLVPSVRAVRRLLSRRNEMLAGQ